MPAASAKKEKAASAAIELHPTSVQLLDAWIKDGVPNKQVWAGRSGNGKTYAIAAWCARANVVLERVHTLTHPTTNDVLDQLKKSLEWNTLVAVVAGRPKLVCIDDADTYAQLDRSFVVRLAQYFQSTGPILTKRDVAIVVCGGLDLLKKTAELAKIGFTVHAMSRVLYRTAKPILPSGFRAADWERFEENLKAVTEDKPEVQVAATVYRMPTAEQVVLYFSEEPWLHPLRMHESALRELDTRSIRPAEKRRQHLKMMNALIDWDHASGQCDEEVPMVALAYRMHDIFSRLQLKKNCSKADVAMEFTKQLSHLSIQKKTVRTQYHLSQDIGENWEHLQQDLKT